METTVKRLVPALLAASLIGGLTACGSNNSNTSSAKTDPQSSSTTTYPLTITNCGSPATIPTQPRKIFAIGQDPVTLTVAAGGADRIVAEAGQGVPVPGAFGTAATKNAKVVPFSGNDPSLETIIASGADFVVSYGLHTTDASALAGVGISSLIAPGNCGAHSGTTGNTATFPEIFDTITLFGKVLGTEQYAAASVESLRQRLTTAQAHVQKPAKPLTAAAIYFYKGQSLTVNGNHSIIHAEMAATGLDDVFGDVDKEYFKGSVEELIKRNPDVLVLSYGYRDNETFADAMTALARTPGLNDLSAVKNGHVIALPYWQTSVDPYAIDGLETIANGLAKIK